jgi:DNA topoisomerase VI subunit B
MSSAATTSRKRKAVASTSTSNKKTRQIDYSAAQAIVKDIIYEKGAVELDASDLLSVAEYTRHLEDVVASLKPKEKSADEVSAAAEKLRSATASGIKKQLQVRFLSSFFKVVSNHSRVLSGYVFIVEAFLQDWRLEVGLRWCLC